MCDKTEEDDNCCPICLENTITHFTECKHGYCLSCVKQIYKCAMCRMYLNHNKVTPEIIDDMPNKSYNIDINSNSNIDNNNDIYNSVFYNGRHVRIYRSAHNLNRIMSGMPGLSYSN